MSDPSPYLDFYSSHGIIPTRQDISDLSRHLERRHALYRHLGLPPGLFRNADILEFGPGSGHNAIATALLEPATYLLVDGNTPSLKSTQALLEHHCPQANVQMEHSSIMKFNCPEKFDIVLCEAVIPNQANPHDFFRHVSQFTKPGGVFVFTCVDHLSVLPEMIRRWLAWDMIRNVPDFRKQINLLVEFFTPDILALPGMSRKPEDWVIDQIIHPWIGPLFSIPEAIETLQDRGMILGSSPKFLTDWRWYKNITGPAQNDHQFVLTSYLRNAANLLDCRIEIEPVPKNLLMRLVYLSRTIYQAVFLQERSGPVDDRNMIILLKELEGCLHPYSPKTTLSISSMISWLESGRKDAEIIAPFRSWWGRGQQYLSCIMT